MTPEQTQTLVRLASQGAPIIVGTYVAGQVRTGKRIDEKSGRTEQYAGVQHAVLCGREVINVKQYVDRDPDMLRRYLDAENDPKKQDALLSCKGGAPCVVQVKGFRFEKGQKVCTGEVFAL